MSQIIRICRVEKKMSTVQEIRMPKFDLSGQNLNKDIYYHDNYKLILLMRHFIAEGITIY